MNDTRTFLTIRFSFLVAAFAVAFFPARSAAEEAFYTVQTTPAPGVYAVPLVVQFFEPNDTRLLLKLDGVPVANSREPLLLSVPDGDDRIFVVEAEAVPAVPGSAPVSAGTYTWRIDRKKPAAPLFSSIPSDGGRAVRITLNESGTISYQMYHPYYKSRSSGTCLSGASVFLPDGAVLCAQGVDSAGNRGPAAVPDVQDLSPGESMAGLAAPFRIISPVSGSWGNRQLLCIEHDPDATVYFSLDGSDPSLSGLIYTGPVMLDSDSLTTLRVTSSVQNERAYSEQVLFSVDMRPADQLASSGLLPDRGMIDIGDFAEIQIPAGFVYGLGEGRTFLEGGKTIPFSAVRGVYRYYPLVISDGKTTWRWVCKSGTLPAEASRETVDFAADSAADNQKSPLVTIYDWYFFSVNYDSDVYYSFDRANWNHLESPVLLDRSADGVVYWYSPAWKEGTVQSVSLPVKPVLSGIPPAGVTANPVFLSMSASNYRIVYEAGSYFWPDVPTSLSPELSSGLLVEVPSGSSDDFTFRFLCEYDGIVHGELDASFTVDRKVPHAPSAGFSSSSVFSRVPLKIEPSGEDMIQLSVQPALFSAYGKSLILNGEEGRPVVYSVRLFAVDRAGNRSADTVYTVTVDINALYVDGSVAVSPGIIRDGSPSAPFQTLDEALDIIRDSNSWRIYLSGSVPLNKTHTIQGSVAMYGTDTKISAGKDATFVLSGGSLEITGCTISREISATQQGEISNAFMEPFFDVLRGKLSFVRSTISLKGGDSTVLIRSANAAITANASRFELESADYAIVFDANNSMVTLEDCTLTASARSVSGLSIVNSGAQVINTRITVIPLLAGRAIESWGSRIALDRADLRRSGIKAPGKVQDTAFWFDDATVITEEKSVTFSGFSLYKTDVKK